MNIRPATTTDLPALLALLNEALTFDPISPEILESKLFFNPCPRRFAFAVWMACDGDAPLGMMQTVRCTEDGRGWLGLFTVAATARRSGIATRLWQRAADDLRDHAVRNVEALAIPANYLTPGLDPRYTDAVCWLEGQGFTRFKDCVNLTALLDRPLQLRDDEKRLTETGVTIRRATQADDRLLDDFFDLHFGANWQLEAALAMNNDPPALHLAIRDQRIIAFSAHSTQNRKLGFFGPMGTAPEARGQGIGRVLLYRCLNDLYDAGHRLVVIPWVGPIRFYVQHVSARVDRVFWRYRKGIQQTA